MRRRPGISGELIAMAGYEQEGAQRGGHIPGAANIPWATAVREDEPYTALIASTYVREAGAWKLAVHQQTPV